MAGLLSERSQNNSFIKHVVGLYLYATGAQRQTISVLSSLNMCSTYPSIAGSGRTNELRDTSTTENHKGQTNKAGSTAETTLLDLDAGSDADDPDWMPDESVDGDLTSEYNDSEDDEDEELPEDGSGTQKAAQYSRRC